MKKDKENLQIHTLCGKGDVGRYVLTCGDPGRVPRIAAQIEKAQEVACNREFLTYTGKIDQAKVTIASTGIGGPSTAILIEEFARLGADTFIRIGTSGGIGEGIKPGDYVISTASMRTEGTSSSYVGPEYPAVAHYQVVQALVKAAKLFRSSVHLGITWSVDGFYSENRTLLKDRLGSMCFKGYLPPKARYDLREVKRMGIKNVEMETGTMFTLCGIYGLRAGAICMVSDKVPWEGPLSEIFDAESTMENCIKMAVRAIKILIKGERTERGE